MAENTAGNFKRVAVLGSAALRDQAAIYSYTADQWGIDQAEEYLDFLDEVMRELADNPTLATPLQGMTGVRSHLARWRNARQGHRIIFEETDSGIYVLRILHTAMNWQEYLSEE